MKILISAAETSSDAHGAQLLNSIRRLSETKVEAFGIGGIRLREEDFKTIVDAKSLRVMGLIEVLWRLPAVLTALCRITNAAKAEKPDIAVLIDFPDFHFRLARRLKKMGIPIVYYIPPKVWVWRKKRVRIMKKLFSAILCILPFEEDFYRDAGVKAMYVGNPLLDELPIGLSKTEARAKLGLDENEKIVVALPGSRPAEIEKHVPLVLQSLCLVAKRMRDEGLLGREEKLKVLMPLASIDDLERCEVLASRFSCGAIELRISRRDSALAMVAADAGIIKSGTSTLEAALLNCPHLVIYKPHVVTGFVFKHFVRFRGPVGLVNLVFGSKDGQERLCPELLCENATVDNIASECFSVLSDGTRREKMITGFKKIREVISKSGRKPSDAAALAVLRILNCRGVEE